MEIRNVGKFVCNFGYKRESGISKTQRLMEERNKSETKCNVGKIVMVEE